MLIFITALSMKRKGKGEKENENAGDKKGCKEKMLERHDITFTLTPTPYFQLWFTLSTVSASLTSNFTCKFEPFFNNKKTTQFRPPHYNRAGHWTVHSSQFTLQYFTRNIFKQWSVVSSLLQIGQKERKKADRRVEIATFVRQCIRGRH